MQKLSSWKYDPANFFRVNYNIKPALTRAVGLDQKTQTLDRPVNCRARDRRRNRDHDAVARPRADAQAIYERQRHADLAVDADARARILALRADLPRLWHDPHIPDRERKRMAVRAALASVRGTSDRYHSTRMSGPDAILDGRGSGEEAS